MKIETTTFHFPASLASNTPPLVDGENEFAAFSAQFAHRAERLRQARVAEPSRHVLETVTEADVRHTAEMWAGGALLAGLAVAALVVWGWPIEPVTSSPDAIGDAHPIEAAAAPVADSQAPTKVALPAVSAPLPAHEPSPAPSTPPVAQATPEEPVAPPASTTAAGPAPSAPPAAAPARTVASLIGAATAPDKPPIKAASVSPPLNWSDARDLQTRLKSAGFDPGPIDGIVGPLTTDAARRYGEARTLASKDPAREMLARLRSEPARSVGPTQSAELPAR
jgi:hypothetical protein